MRYTIEIILAVNRVDKRVRRSLIQMSILKDPSQKGQDADIPVVFKMECNIQPNLGINCGEASVDRTVLGSDLFED